MEVKIGVLHSPREVVVESTEAAEAISDLVAAALGGGTLDLTDDKGRRVIIPGDRIAYVEIAGTTERRVGFAG